MVPDPGLQLQVAIKALRDVVIPALAEPSAVAGEQAHLALATLNMVRDQLPFRERLARTELRNALAAAQAVANAGDGDAALTDRVGDAKQLLERAGATVEELDETRIDLLARLEAYFCEDGERAGGAAAKAYLATLKPQMELQRKWTAPAGFDPGAADLPSLDHMLA